jgi:site-specific DNA-methyltransferase (adenine-specific)
MELNVVYNEDCLEGMNRIEDKSIDMILCDLPYGTTACKWDTIIPFEPLWKQYERIIKDNGAIVLTCREPFTSIMISSNIKDLNIVGFGTKEQGVNFQNAKYMPLQTS